MWVIISPSKNQTNKLFVVVAAVVVVGVVVVVVVVGVVILVGVVVVVVVVVAIELSDQWVDYLNVLFAFSVH